MWEQSTNVAGGVIESGESTLKPGRSHDRFCCEAEREVKASAITTLTLIPT